MRVFDSASSESRVVANRSEWAKSQPIRSADRSRDSDLRIIVDEVIAYHEFFDGETVYSTVLEIDEITAGTMVGENSTPEGWGPTFTGDNSICSRVDLIRGVAGSTREPSVCVSATDSPSPSFQLNHVLPRRSRALMKMAPSDGPLSRGVRDQACRHAEFSSSWSTDIAQCAC
jgi:hypothetical protein